VLERIMAAENAPRVTANPPEQPTLEELRSRHGSKPGEDDLLILKALIPESDIEAMQAAGPIARDYPLLPPQMAEVKQLIETVKSPYVRVATEHWAIDLKR
jgi:oxaloacetate decarboxylase alpha subunit